VSLTVTKAESVSSERTPVREKEGRRSPTVSIKRFLSRNGFVRETPA
jgi:hypothetical protein